MAKVGGMIWVRASRSLGTPREKCVVLQILHKPGEIPQYPNGLLKVVPKANQTPMQEFNCCFKGYVYSGPPLNGYLVEFP